MDTDTVKQLLALNRDFYLKFAEDFSETRSADRINMEAIRPLLFPGTRVLDVGCGNGRLAERLEQEGIPLEYVGIDAAESLIEQARAKAEGLVHVRPRFMTAELAGLDWPRQVGTNDFNLAAMLAVLHHLPSEEMRQNVLRGIASLLAAGGALVVSTWQFTGNTRLRDKIVPWARVGIDVRKLEPRDTLLDWKRGGTGYRFCHELTPEEMEQLARRAGLRVVKQYYGEQNMNLWSIMQKG